MNGALPYLFFFSYSRADWEYDVYLAKFFHDLEKKVAMLSGVWTQRTSDAAGSEPDPQATTREARAERYFQHDLQNQRRWYSTRATQFKSRAQALGIAVVAAGAATSFLQIFRDVFWVPVLTALLGAVVALVEGWRQIARYDETWAAYRMASERMNRERRLYVNGAGEYRGLVDEEAAFVRFVEAIETIVAEEQHIYWQNRSDTSPRAPRLEAASGEGSLDRQGGGGHDHA